MVKAPDFHSGDLPVRSRSRVPNEDVMKIFREVAPVLLFCLGAIVGAGVTGKPEGALVGIIIALFVIVISGGKL